MGDRTTKRKKRKKKDQGSGRKNRDVPPCENMETALCGGGGNRGKIGKLGWGAQGGGGEKKGGNESGAAVVVEKGPGGQASRRGGEKRGKIRGEEGDKK